MLDLHALVSLVYVLGSGPDGHMIMFIFFFLSLTFWRLPDRFPNQVHRLSASKCGHLVYFVVYFWDQILLYSPYQPWFITVLRLSLPNAGITMCHHACLQRLFYLSFYPSGWEWYLVALTCISVTLTHTSVTVLSFVEGCWMHRSP